MYTRTTRHASISYTLFMVIIIIFLSLCCLDASIDHLLSEWMRGKSDAIIMLSFSPLRGKGSRSCKPHQQPHKKRKKKWNDFRYCWSFTWYFLLTSSFLFLVTYSSNINSTIILAKCKARQYECLVQNQAFAKEKTEAHPLKLSRMALAQWIDRWWWWWDTQSVYTLHRVSLTFSLSALTHELPLPLIFTS